MSEQATIHELEGQLDALVDVFGDFENTTRDERREARRLHEELNAIYISRIRDAQGSLDEALRGMSEVVRDQAAMLRTNRVRQILDRIATLVGAAMGTVPAQAEDTTLHDSVPALISEVSGFLRGLADPLTGGRTRPSPDTVVAPAATGGNARQRRLVSAIAQAAREFAEDRFLMGSIGWSRLGASTGSSSSVRGPFQFRRSTWRGLVSRLGERLGVARDDIDDARAQARMMAVVLRGYRDRVTQVIEGAPTPATIYLMHLLGEPAASRVLRADAGASVLDVLRRFYARFPSSSPKGADFADKVLRRNPGVLSDAARAPRSVAGVLRAVDELLLRGEGQYRAIAGEVAAPQQAEVPAWYAVALEEMARGVSELPGNDRHHPDIVKYIRSTHYPLDFEEESDEDVPWCATFVNWCLEAAQATSIKSARARDWLDWGSALDTPRIGCVTVLWRESPESRKGHIGFYAGTDPDGNVQLLGGNQRVRGDESTGCVCISAYPARRVLGHRWPG